ncbi:MAG TPA: 16S rRNA (cytosine(1402)-N(4))-methyltransferase RsmH [Bacteroidales bacterium]|jgi:16S rRNA (cytosine1402-N4)-methyltransferase|nr:16S rRNA (cytosine(1402)-N(4))-methyltransferase RsmH [Bacteroidota bacterium]MZQ47785.1 16S rRNA (cytosine(1402)-N(4))-methyltransferase RsmH [Bacteroidales bacterium]HNR42606.1 16S rRNA (cytosine(1402)-N(4))-methyltransferase RsmH [Bacteroidales bacterium]HPM19186.1 16S rRNA (cytosine(1402)-N(4))-methyltransferase RsmH [Bacteroidales bacterium]HQG78318.1 16S rRNA (cytosine(1402)-N(4))-methyltransferase RsmH [Bacteroidales bacterium]
MYYHVPALLDESIRGLNIRPDGIYVDATFGGGGHSMAILKRLRNGRLIAFDQDEDAMRNVPANKNLIFLNQNFRFLKNNLRHLGIEAIDGLIADLGVSFHQFDEPERGFTFRQDVTLDMRMNKKGNVTAASLLRTLDENAIAKLMYDYGELVNARKIARELVRARAVKPLTKVSDIISALGTMAPVRQENKFYARVFQALRIAVNHEIDYLKELLDQSLEMLKKDGRLVVITYHSLEDRIVKNFMKTGNFEGEEKKDFYGNIITPFLTISKKGIVPGERETEDNKRSRSARLRIAQKI